MCEKSHCDNGIWSIVIWRYFYLCFIETLSLVFDNKWELEFAEVCNSFCFWYNKGTKRAEQQLDSNVAR